MVGQTDAHTNRMVDIKTLTVLFLQICGSFFKGGQNLFIHFWILLKRVSSSVKICNGGVYQTIESLY